jgi:hypothetical protein
MTERTSTLYQWAKMCKKCITAAFSACLSSYVVLAKMSMSILKDWIVTNMQCCQHTQSIKTEDKNTFLLKWTLSRATRKECGNNMLSSLKCPSALTLSRTFASEACLDFSRTMILIWNSVFVIYLLILSVSQYYAGLIDIDDKLITA